MYRRRWRPRPVHDSAIWTSGEALLSEENVVSKFKRLGRHHCHLFSARRMPHLPKKLAPVRAAVAPILLPQDHVSRLYSAVDISNALNIATDVDGNDAINAGVDATLLLRAFVYEGGKVRGALQPSRLWGGRSILYVRREIKHGRKVRGKRNALSLFIRRFNSIDTAKNARVVRWNYGLDEDVRAGLSGC